MKILFVIDQFDSANNGTTISARRFADALASRGNEVRVVSCGSSHEGKYGVSEIRLLPIADHIVKAQGMQFGRPNSKQLVRAMEWAEIVHFFMPFPLSIRGLALAEKMCVPHTAAFHVQPENITFTIGMGNMEFVNNSIYNEFRDRFYNRFTHIHCPSNFIAEELLKHGYTAKLHVISNGISPAFCYNKVPKPEIYAGKYIITMIGRYSAEKRQDILIEATEHSKYADRIQLVLAGQGPLKSKIEKLGSVLPNPPIMNFFSEDELHRLLSYSDLYCHTADVEIEAISCIEAFASGLVPIIANAPRSATPQFALDERSLFEADNPRSLTEKIDYWLDNAEERQKSEKLYAEAGEQYHLNFCAAKTEEMFKEAIEENAGLRPNRGVAYRRA